MYRWYLECMEIYDKVNTILKSNNPADRRSSQGFNYRRSIIKSSMPKDSRALIVLKNVFQPIYNKFRQFRLTISSDNFKPLVASFMYLHDKIAESGEKSTGLSGD